MRLFWVAVLSVGLWGAGDARAQDCGVGGVDCGDGTCCPADSPMCTTSMVGCCPTGSVECPNLGGCCPEGQECGSTACILPCGTGTERCGTDFCIPEGNVCCDDVGHPEISCGPNHYCTPDAECKLAGCKSDGGCHVAALGEADVAPVIGILALFALAVVGRRQREAARS